MNSVDPVMTSASYCFISELFIIKLCIESYPGRMIRDFSPFGVNIGILTKSPHHLLDCMWYGSCTVTNIIIFIDTGQRFPILGIKLRYFLNSL